MFTMHDSESEREIIDLKHFAELAKKTLSSIKFKNEVRCISCPMILTACAHRDKILNQMGEANE
jgi:hypothetical protein